MNAIRKEVNQRINLIPERKLASLLPLLDELVDYTPIIETNLTKQEKNIIEKASIEIDKGNYVLLETIK
jgi:hypothetical protein